MKTRATKYPTFPSHLPLHVVALSVENLWLENYMTLCVLYNSTILHYVIMP